MEEKIAKDHKAQPTPSTLNSGVEGGLLEVATVVVTIPLYKCGLNLLRTFFHQPLAWTVCL